MFAIGIHRVFLRHKRLHENQNSPATCGTCGKAFSHRRSLVDHEKIHAAAFLPTVAPPATTNPADTATPVQGFASATPATTPATTCAAPPDATPPTAATATSAPGFAAATATTTQVQVFAAAAAANSAATAATATTTATPFQGFDPGVSLGHLSRLANGTPHLGQRPLPLGPHSADFQPQCNVCDRLFKGQGALTNHVRTHKTGDKFSCEFCGALFTAAGDLRTHEATHGGESPYLCTLCNAEFVSKWKWLSHQKSHGGGDDDTNTCRDCGKHFPFKSTMEVHRLSHAVNAKEKKHVCTLCDRAFTIKGNLSAHMRTHTGEQNFRCERCDKRFGDKRALATHIRSHTGERYS